MTVWCSRVDAERNGDGGARCMFGGDSFSTGDGWGGNMGWGDGWGDGDSCGDGDGDGTNNMRTQR